MLRKIFFFLLGRCNHSGDAMFSQDADGNHTWECRTCGHQWPRDRGTFRPEEIQQSKGRFTRNGPEELRRQVV